MKVLVIYGSKEGQTKMIAERVVELARQTRCEAELHDSEDWQSEVDISSFDKIIVAGSVHERKHQRALEIFVVAKAQKLQAKPTLFLSVSLSAAFENGMADAQSYVEQFVEYTAWKPSETVLVAGALRHKEYDYFMEQVVRYVVLEKRDVAVVEGDHEFTDWEEVSRRVNTFLKSNSDLP